MTVASATSRIEYSTTAGLLTYAYPFRIFSANELEVHLGTTLQTLNVHYSVTGAGSVGGGNVVLSVDPGNGALLTIERILPLTQGHDYVENDNFPADSHELALDRLTMITQMLHERDRKRPGFLRGSATKDWQFPDPVSYGNDGRPLYIRMNAAHTALEAVHGVLDIIGGVLDDRIPSVTRGALPAAGTIGRLRHVSDDIPGVWIDTGGWYVPQTLGVEMAERFGAIGDGTSHPLSERYATLAEAQAVYSHATALTDEIDWCALQGALLSFGVGGGGETFGGILLLGPRKSYVINQPLAVKHNTIIRGFSSTTNFSGYGSQIYYTGTTANTSAIDITIGALGAEGHAKVLLEDFTILLDDPGVHGINILGASDLWIKRLHIQGQGGSGAGTNRGIWAQDLITSKISECHFRNLRYGIVYNDYCNNNTISANQFEKIDHSSILIRAIGDKGANQVNIYDNNFVRIGAEAHLHGVYVVRPGRNVSIHDNTFEAIGAEAVMCSDTDPIIGGPGGGSGSGLGWSVKDNMFILLPNYCVRLDWVNWSNIGPNSNFLPNVAQPGMYFQDANVQGNSFPGVDNVGGKPLFATSGERDATISSDAFQGMPRVDADPATAGWGVNHFGRMNFRNDLQQVSLFSGIWQRVMTGQDMRVERDVVTGPTTYDVGVYDTYLSVNVALGAATLNLPALAGCPVGKMYIIKDMAANAAVNNITIAADGSEVIIGAASAGTFVIANAGGGAILVHDSDKWTVVANF